MWILNFHRYYQIAFKSGHANFCTLTSNIGFLFYCTLAISWFMFLMFASLTWDNVLCSKCANFLILLRLNILLWLICTILDLSQKAEKQLSLWLICKAMCFYVFLQLSISIRDMWSKSRRLTASLAGIHFCARINFFPKWWCCLNTVCWGINSFLTDLKCHLYHLFNVYLCLFLESQLC